MSEHKYRIIVKVDNDRFVKYRTSDLLSFTKFLDESWNGWRWFNVYDKKTDLQIASFTNKNRPQNKVI